MPRIKTPTTVAEAPEASQFVLDGIKKVVGAVPNLHRIVSNNPAVLEGFVNFKDALGIGQLSPATRERIALAIAELNECNYCLAAHTYLGQTVANLTGAEIDTNRRGRSTDAKADVAVRFAVAIARDRGQVGDAILNEVKRAGYSDAEIVEIIAHVALNTFTNYTNVALQTEIDFPVAKDLAA